MTAVRTAETVPSRRWIPGCRRPRRRSASGRCGSSRRWSASARRPATSTAPRSAPRCAPRCCPTRPRSSASRAPRPTTRPTCSPACRAPARSRVLLLGHLDTVVAHQDHRPLRREGDKLVGSGAVDMKGGDVLAIGVMRALAQRPERTPRLALLLVCDEEWRTGSLDHVHRFEGWDACLCFEGGEQTTQRRRRRRRAAQGGRDDPRHRQGPRRALGLGARPRPQRAAGARRRRPGRRRLPRPARPAPPHLGADRPALRRGVQRRARRRRAVLRLPRRRARRDRGGARRDPARGRRRHAERRADPALAGHALRAGRRRACWPAASTALGRPVTRRSRGGASDASHFAAAIPVTIDGLGPRGGKAHNPGEFVYEASLTPRAEVALAVVTAVL